MAARVRTNAVHAVQVRPSYRVRACACAHGCMWVSMCDLRRFRCGNRHGELGPCR